ncbi:MAG: 3-phosphoshikimate 1-carboxyvinyltransferase, partial [Hyphomicrobium sp.]
MRSQSPTASQPLATSKAGPLTGRVRVPGDKSISHRALIFAALASGVSRIRGLLEADDVVNTAKAVAALGASVEKVGGEWRITGCGVGGLRQPEAPIDFGNSGTGTRLMLGVIAGHDITVRMTGDASLSRRPMGRVLIPLKRMGLQVEEDRDTLPLNVRGS